MTTKRRHRIVALITTFLFLTTQVFAFASDDVCFSAVCAQQISSSSLVLQLFPQAGPQEQRLLEEIFRFDSNLYVLVEALAYPDKLKHGQPTRAFIDRAFKKAAADILTQLRNDASFQAAKQHQDTEKMRALLRNIIWQRLKSEEDVRLLRKATDSLWRPAQVSSIQQLSVPSVASSEPHLPIHTGRLFTFVPILSVVCFGISYYVVHGLPSLILVGFVLDVSWWMWRNGRTPLLKNGKSHAAVFHSAAQLSKKITNDCRVHSGPKVILVAGLTAAGKSRLTKQLEGNLSGHVKTLNLSRYTRPPHTLPIGEYGQPDYDLPTSLDLSHAFRDIRNLLAGNSVMLPDSRISRASGLKVQQTLHLESDDVLIVDSIHALDPMILRATQDAHPIKVFVTAPSDIRLMRRTIRNHDEFKTPVTYEETLHQWPNVRKTEVESLLPNSLNADYVLESSYFGERIVLFWQVIRRFIQTLFHIANNYERWQFVTTSFRALLEVIEMPSLQPTPRATNELLDDKPFVNHLQSTYSIEGIQDIQPLPLAHSETTPSSWTVMTPQKKYILCRLPVSSQDEARSWADRMVELKRNRFTLPLVEGAQSFVERVTSAGDREYYVLQETQDAHTVIHNQVSKEAVSAAATTLAQMHVASLPILATDGVYPLDVSFDVISADIPDWYKQLNSYLDSTESVLVYASIQTLRQRLVSGRLCAVLSPEALGFENFLFNDDETRVMNYVDWTPLRCKTAVEDIFLMLMGPASNGRLTASELKKNYDVFLKTYRQKAPQVFSDDDVQKMPYFFLLLICQNLHAISRDLLVPGSSPELRARRIRAVHDQLRRMEKICEAFDVLKPVLEQASTLRPGHQSGMSSPDHDGHTVVHSRVPPSLARLASDDIPRITRTPRKTTALNGPWQEVYVVARPNEARVFERHSFSSELSLLPTQASVQGFSRTQIRQTIALAHLESEAIFENIHAFHVWLFKYMQLLIVFKNLLPSSEEPELETLREQVKEEIVRVTNLETAGHKVVDATKSQAMRLLKKGGYSVVFQLETSPTRVYKVKIHTPHRVYFGLDQSEQDLSETLNKGRPCAAPTVTIERDTGNELFYQAFGYPMEEIIGEAEREGDEETIRALMQGLIRQVAVLFMKRYFVHDAWAGNFIIDPHGDILLHDFDAVYPSAELDQEFAFVEFIHFFLKPALMKQQLSSRILREELSRFEPFEELARVLNDESLSNELRTLLEDWSKSRNSESGVRTSEKQVLTNIRERLDRHEEGLVETIKSSLQKIDRTYFPPSSLRLSLRMSRKIDQLWKEKEFRSFVANESVRKMYEAMHDKGDITVTIPATAVSQEICQLWAKKYPDFPWEKVSLVVLEQPRQKRMETPTPESIVASLQPLGLKESRIQRQDETNQPSDLLLLEPISGPPWWLYQCARAFPGADKILETFWPIEPTFQNGSWEQSRWLQAERSIILAAGSDKQSTVDWMSRLPKSNIPEVQHAQSRSSIFIHSNAAVVKRTSLFSAPNLAMLGLAFFVQGCAADSQATSVLLSQVIAVAIAATTVWMIVKRLHHFSFPKEAKTRRSYPASEKIQLFEKKMTTVLASTWLLEAVGGRKAFRQLLESLIDPINSEAVRRPLSIVVSQKVWNHWTTEEREMILSFEALLGSSIRVFPISAEKTLQDQLHVATAWAQSPARVLFIFSKGELLPETSFSFYSQIHKFQINLNNKFDSFFWPAGILTTLSFMKNPNQTAIVPWQSLLTAQAEGVMVLNEDALRRQSWFDEEVLDSFRQRSVRQAA